MPERLHKGTKLLETPPNYTVVDIETTGFSPADNEIIEIGAIKVVNNEVVGTYQTLVKPLAPIPEKITELTGISNDFVVGAPHLKTAITSFLDFLDSPTEVLLAHNAHFDVNFLYDASYRYGYTLSNNFVDFLYLARKQFTLPNYKLETIAKHLGVHRPNAHRADIDCLVLNDAYQASRQMKTSSTVLSAASN